MNPSTVRSLRDHLTRLSELLEEPRLHPDAVEQLTPEDLDQLLQNEVQRRMEGLSRWTRIPAKLALAGVRAVLAQGDEPDAEQTSQDIQRSSQY